MRKIKKVLIANRGEIALRVVRACAEVGMESVAVFSEADRTALHVRAADEAYPIGPAPSVESYLRIDKLLEVARKSGADAVHPGYGFLAENANFAQAVLDEGLTWIGPSPNAMRMLGDKLEARRTAQAAGVPTVPGTDVPTDDVESALAAAELIGYPVLIKASAGGGGKGMRIVHSRDDLEAALRSAQSEAQSSFGSGTVYLEKYLELVRHVEIQLLGDTHGNVIHLGERECSVQRRYQKLIEESPSVAVDADLRERMGSVAVAAARAVGYTSAGTVEFLLDKFKNFYFLEVNTRLQVEHPVTELVTGVDLVLEQFRIASGRPLRLTQSDVRLNGHAMECRIAAEDPFNNFAPSLGTIAAVSEPGGAGVRVDSSVYAGAKVSVYYDPMIAKLIVWAPSRAHAILRMRRALREYRIAGIQTNIPFHLRVMQSLDFQRGRLDTKFVDRLLANTAPEPQEEDERLLDVAAMAAALVLDRKLLAGSAASNGAAQHRAPSSGDNAWRLAGRRQGLR
ncbi:MAG: acetyl-CoA carboxylase biotin carboxylase subunit [Chloroflexota bacterium]|nr:acetyl-CoA carboxylase biotin carboxylase subunit [Chloroflexota bacterium]MDQ5864177.1 acetyl-CoA carboxylase biotin carboxylase subunit [Chloroflexota bacterium]